MEYANAIDLDSAVLDNNNSIFNQKLDKVSRSKSQFIHTISHELRTPLTGILGMAEMLHSEPLTSKQLECVEDIQQAGSRMLGMVNHILGIIDKKTAFTSISPLTLQTQPRVLLVEDDLIVQKVHRLMLEKIGCLVDVASNGQEALTTLDKGYHIIFMDVGLPDKSGIEITAEIRRREATEKHIPIIALTAYSFDETKQDCLDAGADEVATKPIEIKALRQLLQRWVIT